jgi:hypothetical protein
MTSPYGCPACATPLTGAASCPSCGLPLTGPTAGRLWQVDQQLAALQGQLGLLTAERADLLARLRAGDTGPLAPAAWPAPGTPWPTTTQAPAPPRPPRETSPQRVQNLLLALGALLLALAGVVFTAVTYQRLGVVGRALVLLAITAAAGSAPVPLRRRSLTASAEAVGAVAIALGVLDAVALHRTGLADGVDSRSYYAVAFAVLAALAAGYARVVPLQGARLAAALLAQVPVPVLLGRLEASLPVAASVLAGQGLVDLLLAARSPLPRVSRWVTGIATVPLCLVALSLSAQAADEGNHAAGAGLVGVAVVLVSASLLTSVGVQQTLAVLPVVPLVGAAALAAVHHRLTSDQQPLVLVAVALLALPVAARVPLRRRTGPVLSTLVLSGVSVLVQAVPVVQAVAGPLGWLGDPWSRTAESARDALAPHLSWDGTVVTLVVLAGAAVAAVVGGLLLERPAPAAPFATVLLVPTAATVPLGFATSYRDALLLLLVAAVVLATAAGSVLHRLRELGGVLAASATATALLAAAWSVADQDSTLTVLPLAAIVVAALAVLLPGALTATALALAGAELAAVGAAQDLTADQVGALLVLGTAVAVGASLVLRGRHRLGAEAAAVALAVTSVGLSARDPGWLSWVLVAHGLLALTVSLRADRRQAGAVGGALLVASSWVRLVDAHVVAPEPYVAPLAAVALVLGHLRRRAQPELGSLPAYGGGLTLALVPSLLRSFADDTPTRALLLLVVAVGVVLVGARTRLRAPLVVGGLVVVADGLHLLGPYAAALPRWLLLGTLGLVLVVLGATYEQRLRELHALRDRYLRLG